MQDLEEAISCNCDMPAFCPSNPSRFMALGNLAGILILALTEWVRCGISRRQLDIAVRYSFCVRLGTLNAL
jgi:hypothetical protein